MVLEFLSVLLSILTWMALSSSEKLRNECLFDCKSRGAHVGYLNFGVGFGSNFASYVVS